MSSLLQRAAHALRTRLGAESPEADNPAGAAGTAAYRARMRQEIEAYRQVENVHDLPEIFHLWSNRYVRTKMETVFEVSSFNDFYTKYMLRYAEENPGELVEIASLGAGNGDTEVGLGKVLRDKGFTGFRFHCLDVNPDMLARGRNLAQAAGLEDHYSFEEADAARWEPAEPLAVVMAHQALHHFVELEAIFANVKAAIGDRGYFLTNDMIGRNGHQRWPEALALVHQIWREMPDRYKYNHQLKRFESLYENWDCSKEGFEGIRAQDILPLLLKDFYFEAFVAYGNIVDVFVDRGFGHNFDPHNVDDVAFIERLGARDEEAVDQSQVKPCQMIAAMRARPVAFPRYYRHWSPEFCLRVPE
jgi:SAM-dependent methyltransferase